MPRLKRSQGLLWCVNLAFFTAFFGFGVDIDVIDVAAHASLEEVS